MATADLPRTCTVAALAEALGEADALSGESPALVVEVADDCFVDVAVMAFLCSWAGGSSARGARLHLRGDADALRYLARMDLCEHLGLDYAPGARRDETGRFIPLKLIVTGKGIFSAVNAICALVLQQIDNSTAFIPALERAVNEFVDNTVLLATKVRQPQCQREDGHRRACCEGRHSVLHRGALLHPTGFS